MSEHAVDFIPTGDVLLRDPALAHRLELPVLGIATRFETNSRYVLDVVEESFGLWRTVNEAMRADGPDALMVRIIVHEGFERSAGGLDQIPVRHICPDTTRLIAHSPGSVAISDPSRREAVAYVSTELAADGAQFRASILEAITLALLSHFDRHPVHAAAVSDGTRAVLLAAPSGTGKSTLAYLAHEAGLNVMSEDRVWIQLEPRVRVWGWPGRVRLLSHSSAIFRQGGRRGAESLIDGKRKLVVEIGDRMETARFVAEDVVVCLLERGSMPASLERIDADTLAEGLTRQLAAGFDRFPERQSMVTAALAQCGGWRMRLSSNPREALPLLRRMLSGQP